MALSTPRQPDAGQRMHDLMRELFPHVRGLGGAGVSRTLDTLGRWVPIERHEMPSGTQCFDWTVPREWRFRSAWVADARGRRVIDSAASNLHVVVHSRPVRAAMTLDELRPHLHTDPRRPAAVPYRHTFYAEGRGFCLADPTLRAVLTRLGDAEKALAAALAARGFAAPEVL